jgi:glycosyltransferase involved in cell wall biosynthesis
MWMMWGPDVRLVVIGPFPPLKGGISQHTARLAEALLRSESDVELYSWASQYPNRLFGREQRDPAAATTPGVDWRLRWWNPLSWLQVALRVRRADAILLPWVTPVHSLPQLLWLRSTRGLRIIHVHNVLPHEPMPLARWLAKRVLGAADLLICHSQSLVEELQQLGVSSPAIVTAMPSLLPVHSVDLPLSEPLRLLFFGTIRRYKGLPVAVSALEELVSRGRPVSLTIAGEVWDESEVPTPDQAATLPIDTLYGYVSDDDLVDLVSSHHIVVAPYRSATQSAVVPVAFACGRPVVATTVGGLSEVVVDGVNGALAPPEDSAAFADAIERVAGALDEVARGASESAPSWSEYADVVWSEIPHSETR